ncbi:MAG: hypothetical protein Q8Q73_04820 [Stagnimonas sp.]|nr:hypothetical protein [Stagnimonas sp.]
MRHAIVIQRHRPFFRLLLTIGISAALALAGWGLYRYTRQSAVADFEKATTERDRLLDERRSLTQQLRAAKADIGKLRDELAYAEQSKSIDGDACRSVRESLGKLEAESASLREQLAFYRGIVSPKEARAGVRVQDLKLRRTATGWRYELVLIQAIREESRIAGAVELTIEGVQGAKQTQLAMADLVTAGEKNLLFSFKYFEEFSGEFRLPAGFKPARVIVTLKPANDRPTVMDQYNWSSIETLQERSND